MVRPLEEITTIYILYTNSFPGGQSDASRLSLPRLEANNNVAFFNCFMCEIQINKGCGGKVSRWAQWSCEAPVVRKIKEWEEWGEVEVRWMASLLKTCARSSENTTKDWNVLRDVSRESIYSFRVSTLWKHWSVRKRVKRSDGFFISCYLYL